MADVELGIDPAAVYAAGRPAPKPQEGGAVCWTFAVSRLNTAVGRIIVLPAACPS